jgi:AcrR family transcriptional regulator
MQTKSKQRADADHPTPEAILDAAEVLIRAHGMAGLRLTAIADAVGITHPLILHHFGSKDGLIDAIARRHASRIRERLGPLYATEPGTPLDLHKVLERMQQSLLDDGVGEITFWGIRERPDILQPALNEVVSFVLEASVARRLASKPGQDAQAVRAEVKQVIHVVSLLLWGQALVGPQLNAALGLAHDDRTAGRDYLAMLLLQRLVTT